MIDEYSADRTGWARFSDDYEMRFRLGRSVDGRPLVVNSPGIVESDRCATFLLLNPSVANAFDDDPTVGRCRGFARSWGCDVYQVANANAFRSTDPRQLYKRSTGFRGDGDVNNQEIRLACVGAWRIIVGWGTHGKLGDRGAKVIAMLRAVGMPVYHLGLTKDGYPKHPLYLKATTEPMEWLP